MAGVSAVDPLFAQWLMSDAYRQVSTDATLKARWGDRAQSTERVTTIAAKADAAAEAARQIAFLGGGGPLVIEEHSVLGEWASHLGRVVRLSIDRLGYATTVTLRHVFDNGSSLDLATAFAAGQATAPLPAAGRALKRIDMVQGGQVYPGYDFSGAALPAGATLTRASTKRFINAAGTLATAAINAPAFDYDPVTLALRGLLIEPAATNVTLDSQAFTTSRWSRNGTFAASDNSLVAPDGTTTGSAWTGIRNSTNGRIYETFFGSGGRFPNSVQLSPSFWIKPVSTSGILQIQSTYGPSLGSAELNLALLSTSVWQRTHLGHPAVTPLTPFVSSAAGANGLHFDSKTGAVLSVGMWGVQLEVGTAPTSYIPTTTASASREADVLTLAGATIGIGNPDVFVIGVEDDRSSGTSTLTVIRRL